MSSSWSDPAPAVTVPGRAPADSRPRRTQALMPPMAARLVAFVALATFGLVQWSRLVEPAPTLGFTVSLLAAVGASLLALRVRGSSRSTRARTVALLAAGLVPVAALCAGVPFALLADPTNWAELARRVGEGLSTLPTVRVPYTGLDEWTRVVLILGGTLLTGLAALLAFAPRREGATGFQTLAAIALGALYAVPAIQREIEHPFIPGVAFVLLLALFLWLERVDRPGAPQALLIVGAACLLALAAAPRLDGAQALVDYEQIAQSLSGGAQTSYTWDHGYGPLDWPRDGREVLRVRARTRAYWKATNLTAFDGVRWRQDPSQRGQPLDTPLPGGERWQQTIDVTVRALRSSRFVAAGTALEIRKSPVLPVRAGPGIFESAEKPLRRGNTYEADVYTPRPTASAMRSSTQTVDGMPYPDVLRRHYAIFGLPASTGPGASAPRLAVMPLWGQNGRPLAITGLRDLAPRPLNLARTPYGRAYALAQRLRARSATPYDFMVAVERYLSRGFEYSERPPSSRYPLASFLFRDKAGYCQQFSGAMALLLRLGGVPARVAAGFAPGSRNSQRGGQFIVRDIDAHSWVEVFFPGIGWVTRDPTPAGSPARSQIADLARTTPDSNAVLGDQDASVPDGGAASGATGTTAATSEGGGSVWPVVAGVALVFVLALGGGLLWLRVATRRLDRAADDPQVAELQRALRRSGRAPRPDLTLDALARRFAGTPAESYVRSLAQRRYGFGAEHTTRSQRAGLRRELARGRRFGGRLRAWWALPPRV